MTDVYDSLRGRVAIVTGAAQGIGRAMAAGFARSGALPVVADLNEEAARSVAAEIGGQTLAVRTDVSDPASLDALREAVLARHGRIDILVNNAAVFSTLAMRPFWEIPLGEWERVLKVNTTGAFLASRAMLEPMRRAGWGRIVNISAAAVRMGRPNYLHYVTSKAAIDGLTRAMAHEVGGFGITVNAVAPGATYTEVPRKTVTEEQKRAMIAMQSVPRPGTPADMVGAVLFLSSDASAYMSGQVLLLDGGLTHS